MLIIKTVANTKVRTGFIESLVSVINNGAERLKMRFLVFLRTRSHNLRLVAIRYTLDI